MKISSSFPVGAHTFLFVSRSRRIKSFLLSLIILKNTLCNSSYRKNYCIFTLRSTVFHYFKFVQISMH